MKTPSFWQSRNFLSTALLPASLLYRAGAWADRRLATPQRVARPVISVGNITAGGAGKTPATLALLPVLRALGYTPHILTRGYGGAAHHAHLVTETDSAASVGDEAVLLANAAITWVGADRVASAHTAIAAGAGVLLCDDALQHHALAKDISLLVIDGPFGVGNGRLIPAGPLREPFATAITRADAVIVVGEDTQRLATQVTLPVFNASLQPMGDTSFLARTKWLAFAGIGRPEKFFTTLRSLGAELVATQAFPDHHHYREDELATLLARAEKASAALITTEKDAVKLPPALRSRVHVLPVQLTFADPASLSQWLAKKLSAPSIS